MIYTLLLCLAVAVAAAGFFLRGRNAPLGNGLIAAASLGVILALGVQVHRTLFSDLESAPPNRAQAVVSYFVAGQVIEEVGAKRGTVLLIFPPASVLSDEAVENYTSTFERVLRAAPELQLQVARLDVPRKAAKAGNLPAAAFQQVAGKSPAPAACVSFAGIPAGTEALLGATPSCPWFVFDPYSTTHWLGSLKKGSIRAVVVPRPGLSPDAFAKAGGEPGIIFERLYLMATPANADEVAAKLPRK
jgi:hypothetical protein